MTREPDNFDELESALRNLPLRQPSAALDVRIRRSLAPKVQHRWIYAIAGGSLAAAAALLLAFWLGSEQTTAPIASTTAPAIGAQASSAGEHWTDEGIVGYASDGPVRQYRIVGELATTGGQNRTVEEVIEVVSQAY